MKRFSLRHPFVVDISQQQNNEDLLAAVNETAQFVFHGAGAPAFTPPDGGRALYIRIDGGVNTTLYVYEGSTWSAK